MNPLLPRLSAAAVTAARPSPVPADVLAAAAAIVHDVQQDGTAAVRRYAERFDGLASGASLWATPDECAAAHAALPQSQRELLARTAARIATFAAAQRASLTPFDLPILGGVASQRLAPVERAGCYAPGGRAPLPSSLLMTVVTARTAGVAEVYAASPRPAPITLAAAHVAGAEGVLRVGGAQAIAAFAFGCDGMPPCDVVAGPGNHYVAAAKLLVQGRVGVDLPAGPSELVVLADAAADPARIAADLLAQAEHDPAARPFLITTHEPLARAVEAELALQLPLLATHATAQAALQNGAAVVCRDLAEAITVSDRLAPEHLQLAVMDPAALASRVRHYGALFLGQDSTEVLGDYGAGPNHVLPTAGAARFTGGLSVFHFLRVRTWLAAGRDASLWRDAAELAFCEGLPGHAAAAHRRLPSA